MVHGDPVWIRNPDLRTDTKGAWVVATISGLSTLGRIKVRDTFGREQLVNIADVRPRDPELEGKDKP